jgi:hypothetical protein
MATAMTGHAMVSVRSNAMKGSRLSHIMFVIHHISTASAVCCVILIKSRARFPGAPSTQMTTKMEFVTPTQFPVIPTYTVMNSEGNLEDQQRQNPEVSEEQALGWYKNMLTCKVA